MVSSINSFITNNDLASKPIISGTGILGGSINRFQDTLLPENLAGQGFVSATSEAAGTIAGKTLNSVAANSASTVAQTAVSGTKRSFISKLFRLFSGEWADDAANAFANRNNIPFKEGFKNNFGIKKACEEVAKESTKNTGVFAKIGSTITKVCPFLKNSKISKSFGFLKNNLATIVIYGMAAFKIFDSWKGYGAAEGIKETYKFGIVTACIMACELIASLLTVCTHGVAAPLKYFAPIAGSAIGSWLGDKILGKSAEEKEKEMIAAKHSQQLRELAQNPQFIQMIQKNPQLTQQLQENPQLTEQIYENLKKQNPQNGVVAQTGAFNNQFNSNKGITPEEQKRRDDYASQFGNPYQTTSLGRFSNLVHNVDAPFAQMVARHESTYNPFQTYALYQQLNNELAARGYIFG